MLFHQVCIKSHAECLDHLRLRVLLPLVQPGRLSLQHRRRFSRHILHPPTLPPDQLQRDACQNGHRRLLPFQQEGHVLATAAVTGRVVPLAALAAPRTTTLSLLVSSNQTPFLSSTRNRAPLDGFRTNIKAAISTSHIAINQIAWVALG